MIISYSNDFVFIRIPKCASTTCVVGLYDMGFVNESEGDICTGIEGDKISKDDSVRDSINWPKRHGGKTLIPLIDPNLVTHSSHVTDTRVHRQHIWHSPYKKIVEVGLIDDGMPCVSTIRHPVSRFLSITGYLSSEFKQISSDPNETWDLFKNDYNVFGDYHDMFKVPQNYYVCEGATLFNVENTYDWIEKFTKEKGYEYIQPQHCKNFKHKQKIPLTKGREKEIIDWFKDDFLLWEQSYREFN